MQSATGTLPSPLEKPQNGIAGLKHLRHDIVSGIVVSLVSLPLSSGIAIASGVGAKFLMNVYLFRRAVKESDLPDETRPTLFQGIYDFFANPVWRREMVGDAYHLYLNKPLVCFNTMRVSAELDKVPKEARSVFVHLDRTVSLIDHTSCDNLLSAVQSYSDNNVPVEIIGFDSMRPLSNHHASARLSGRASELAAAPAMA